MEKEKLDEILRKHYKWLAGQKDGERADLRNADLRHVNLTEAILRDADFKDVILSDKTEGLTPKILDKYFPMRIMPVFLIILCGVTISLNVSSRGDK